MSKNIINNSDSSDSENDKNYKIQKKRGRPRKNTTPLKLSNILKPISYNKDKKDQDDEIILHLPLYDDIVSSSEKNLFTMKDESDNIKMTNIIESLSNSENDNKYVDNNDIKNLINEIKKRDIVIKKRDIVIKKLKTNLNEIKNDNNYDNSSSAMKDIKTKMLNLNLININKDNKSIIVDKTDISCWWCAHNFDTMPCFIPDRYFNEKFYVFGCFCTYNCAMAYNLSMNDYRVSLRISLIKKLFSKIFSNMDQISVAPPKELLKKFGGYLSIEEFRDKTMLCKKEYKLSLPPLIHLLPVVEEIQKDYAKNIR